MAHRSLSASPSAEGGDQVAAAARPPLQSSCSQESVLATPREVPSRLSERRRSNSGERAGGATSVVSGRSSKSPTRRSTTRRDTSDGGAAERIATAVRLRPPLARERGGGGCVIIEEPNKVQLSDPQGKRSFTFECDFAFDSSNSEHPGYADQAAVYRSIGTTLVERAVQGFNCCLVAYGQTGTGKTHTLHGDWSKAQQRGLLPRIAEGLLEELDALRSDGAEVQARASYLEIYNNRLFDLLAPPPARQLGKSRGRLDIHTHPKIGVYVDNLSELPIQDFKHIERLVTMGGRNKHTAATTMNARSSRSHTIFSMAVEVRNASLAPHNRMAIVQVVDLAGRESEQTSECTGERFQELKFINQSLFHLAKCIQTLSAGKADHIPFRDSKLTLLLSESFQRNSFDENVVTCRFLESTGRITTHPAPNRFCAQDLQAQLQSEIVQMQAELQQGDTGSLPTLLKDSQLLLNHVMLSWTKDFAMPQRKSTEVSTQESRIEEASRHASRMLGSAASLLEKVDQANSSAVAALDEADGRLAAVEARVEEMCRGSSRGSAEAQATSTREARSPSGVPKLPSLGQPTANAQAAPVVTFSIELPPIVFA